MGYLLTNEIVTGWGGRVPAEFPATVRHCSSMMFDCYQKVKRVKKLLKF